MITAVQKYQKSIVKYNQGGKSIKIPFVIYVYLGSLLEKK